jgi:predicted DNA-binding protein
MKAESKRKAMTLRIDTDTAEQLEAIAHIEGVPMSQVVREALLQHIEERRGDVDFQKRLKDSLERNQKILERLGK